MSFRPPSSSGRPGTGQRVGTASGRPPGTATRLTTGMERQGVVGGGTALAMSVQVADRPVTQQGLGGMKTGGPGGRAGQRMVQDRSYYLGLLRSKIADLTTEINNMTKKNDTDREDQSSYVTYEKRAETLAAEIKDLQGELGDYNTLVDKINLDENTNDIQLDLEDMKAQNDREEKSLDTLFEQKQAKENIINQLEIEIKQEKQMADNMVADMPPDMRQKYMKLKDTNEHLLQQLERGQQELDSLNMKKGELDDELAASPVKQEAVRLYEQLHELEEKRDQLLEETQSRGTPAEEREKLLKQVKEDNQEIASMDRQSNELREKIAILQDDIRQLDMDIEENQGERNQKYKELKKREETMNDFLESFEDAKAQEIERIAQMEQNVVLILENMSKNMQRGGALPSREEFTNMREDLNFKEGEMEKAKTTASGLAGESEKLHQDLAKVEQLEAKITGELEQLRTKIDTMTQELEVYSDIDKLKTDADTRKKKLGEDKVILHKRRETFKKLMQQLTSQYEALKAQLNDNETYAQLGNLERKWQHHEQNNFVMKEFIATKTMESDYRNISKKVSGLLSEYNKMLQDINSGKAATGY